MAQKLQIAFDNNDIVYIDISKMNKERGLALWCEIMPSDCIEIDETDADCIYGDM